MLGMPCFWEIFAGAAGLTSAFANAGWPMAPPNDILFCAEFDTLTVLFLGVCFGVIFEKRSPAVACGAALLEFVHGW